MNRNLRKPNNHGYSLIELITVIAILAIVGIGSITLLGVVPRRHVTGCTKQVVYYLEKARTNAMSFKDARLILTNTDLGVCASLETTKGSDVTISAPEQIGEKNLTVSYKLLGEDESVAEHVLNVVSYGSLPGSMDESLIFSFDRSAGSFKNAFVGATDLGNSVSTIYITKGNWTMQLDLVQLTGKVTYAWKE